MRKFTTLIAAVIVGGCATVDVPQTKNPQQTIAAAEERGVEDNPKAKLYLEMAKDSLSQAQGYMRKNEERAAKLKLLQAEADAELALAMARLDDARDEVRSVQTKIDELQNEIEQVSR